MEVEAFDIAGCCTEVLFAPLGPIETNVYVVSDGAGGVIVCDPADNPEAIMEMVGSRPVSALFVTHKHYDHVGALRHLRDETGAKVYATSIDAPDIESGNTSSVGKGFQACPVDVRVEDGDVVEVGATRWQVMLTPGHTPGSCCFYLAQTDGPDPEGVPVLLSGDTLFRGTIGRTDFPGGSIDNMRASLRKLGTLPDETAVFPGHNGITTIGTERVRVIESLGGEA